MARNFGHDTLFKSNSITKKYKPREVKSSPFRKETCEPQTLSKKLMCGDECSSPFSNHSFQNLAGSDDKDSRRDQNAAASASCACSSIDSEREPSAGSRFQPALAQTACVGMDQQAPNGAIQRVDIRCAGYVEPGRRRELFCW